MLKFIIPAGSVSQDIPIPIYDSSSQIGAKLAGLTYATAGTWYYSRQGASGGAVAMSLVTKTKGTWASLGFVAIDGTNMPGDYELSIPDAALAAGAAWVKIQGKGATNAVPVDIFIDLSVKPVNATQILGTAIATPATAGVLDVNVKNISNSVVNTSSAQVGVNIVSGGSGSGASADQVWDEVVEGSVTARQIQMLMLALIAALSNGANGGAATINLRNYSDTKNLVTKTVDENGNCTAITVNLA